MDTLSRVNSVIESQSASESLEEYDWLDWIQLACDLEEEFEVTVSDAEIEECRSVELLTEYIESLLSEVSVEG